MCFSSTSCWPHAVSVYMHCRVLTVIHAELLEKDFPCPVRPETIEGPLLLTLSLCICHNMTFITHELLHFFSSILSLFMPLIPTVDDEGVAL